MIPASGYTRNSWRWFLHPNDPDYEERPSDEEIEQGEREVDEYFMREIDDEK